MVVPLVRTAEQARIQCEPIRLYTRPATLARVTRMTGLLFSWQDHLHHIVSIESSPRGAQTQARGYPVANSNGTSKQGSVCISKLKCSFLCFNLSKSFSWSVFKSNSFGFTIPSPPDSTPLSCFKDTPEVLQSLFWVNTNCQTKLTN